VLSAQSAGFGDGAPYLAPIPARASDAVADNAADVDREPVVVLAPSDRRHREPVQHNHDDTPEAA
jgi:hypothetical protein